MLKSCLPYLGSPDCLDNNNDSKSKELEGQTQNNNCPSFDSHSTFQSKHIFVRVVHAGGKVDHYPNAVLAAKLLENLPGKWLARPEVFKQPHESIVCPEEYLLPGHKYYVIPLSTIRKLKRKHSKMDRRIEEESCSDASSASAAVEPADYQSEELFDQDDSFCSAREFYARKEKRPTSTSGNGNGSSGASKRGRILLPHAKPKPCSGYTWEPGLTSIQEVSP